MLLREEQVGINLRYFRECDGLSIEAMADKLHLSVEELKALEAGAPGAVIPLRTLTAIYTKYGVNPEQIFKPLHYALLGRLTDGQ